MLRTEQRLTRGAGNITRPQIATYVRRRKTALKVDPREDRGMGPPEGASRDGVLRMESLLASHARAFPFISFE